MRAALLLAFSVVVALVATAPLGCSLITATRCSSDADCTPGTTCSAAGDCIAVVVAGEGEGGAAEGEGGAAEGEGGASEGEGGASEGEGGAAEGEGGASEGEGGAGEGEGGAGEGEGGASEGEGGASEGEGGASEGEGGAGEGEGGAGEGEGEGEGGPIQFNTTVVVRYTGATVNVSVDLEHTIAIVDGGSLCGVIGHSGSVVTLSCFPHLGDIFSELIGVSGDGVDFDDSVTVRFVPGDWLDLTRARRARVHFDLTQLPPGSVVGDAVYVPANAVPDGAIADAHIFNDSGLQLPVERDAGNVGLWTNLPAGGDDLWLYFDDVGGPITPNLSVAWPGYDAVLHFGTAIQTDANRNDVDDVAVLGNFTTANVAVAGRGANLAAGPVSAGFNGALVTPLSGTLSAWVHVSTLGSAVNPIFLYAVGPVTVAPGGGFQSDEAHLHFDAVTSSACGWASEGAAFPPGLCSNAISVVDGDWHQVALTWSNNVERLFIDGQPQPSSIHNAGTNSALGEVLRLGGPLSDPSGVRTYRGLIDEVRASSSALSESQIALEYRSIANTSSASGQRFVDALHFVGSFSVDIPADGSSRTTFNVVPSPELQNADGKPVFIVAYSASHEHDLAQIDKGFGIDRDLTSWSDTTPLAANGLAMTVQTAVGILKLAGNVTIRHETAGGSAPAADTVATIVAIYEGTPSSATFLGGATTDPANATLALPALPVGGALSFGYVGIANGLDVGGDVVASVPLDSGLALSLALVPADAALTHVTVQRFADGDTVVFGYDVNP